MLPVVPSALLVSWGNAALRGRISPDTAADRIVGRTHPHRVLGLPGQDAAVSLPLALPLLRRLGVGGLRLVLPVPGDPSGLPGPAEFNAQALAAGEAVVTVGGAALGLLPEQEVVGDAAHRAPPGASTPVGMVQTTRVLWRVHHTNPASNPASNPATGGSSLAEAERDLKECLAEATDALVRLDVAAGGAGLPALLAELREDRAMSSALAPGYSSRAASVLALARQVRGIVALASRDDGAAVSAGEASRRTTVLRDLRAAARRAEVAAYNAVLEPARG